ncbi:hypothetical protein JB92DRAFT_851016 [Gautieria morchelliformis]|nr:hypothetical protein JB92DRAFT_851016 [Gautieria morchelliformis]
MGPQSLLAILLMASHTTTLWWKKLAVPRQIHWRVYVQWTNCICTRPWIIHRVWFHTRALAWLLGPGGLFLGDPQQQLVADRSISKIPIVTGMNTNVYT